MRNLRCGAYITIISLSYLPLYMSKSHAQPTAAPHFPYTTITSLICFVQGTFSLAGAGSCTSCAAVSIIFPHLRSSLGKSHALILQAFLTMLPPLIPPLCVCAGNLQPKYWKHINQRVLELHRCAYFNSFSRGLPYSCANRTPQNPSPLTMLPQHYLNHPHLFFAGYI